MVNIKQEICNGSKNILIIQKERSCLPFSSNVNRNSVFPLISSIDVETGIKCYLHRKKESYVRPCSQRKIQLEKLPCLWKSKVQAVGHSSWFTKLQLCLLWGCQGAVWLTSDRLRYTGRLMPHVILPTTSLQLKSVGLVACFKRNIGTNISVNWDPILLLILPLLTDSRSRYRRHTQYKHKRKITHR